MLCVMYFHILVMPQAPTFLDTNVVDFQLIIRAYGTRQEMRNDLPFPIQFTIYKKIQFCVNLFEKPKRS